MGTKWPLPADLSALEFVCLNKSKEVKGGFAEGMMGPACNVCCVFVYMGWWGDTKRK